MNDAEPKITTLQEQVPNLPDQVQLLYRAVECSRNGIVLTDPRRPDNPIIYCNKAFAEMSGFRIDQILGRNCRFLQRDDRDQEAIREIREAIAEERPIATILRNYKKNGTLFYNELTVSPVHDASGTLINFVGVQNDISARKDAERRVSEFYSVISHELRTPLTSINGALRVIQEGSAGRVNKHAMKLVEIALESSERLIRLINNILDIKKIESGKFKLQLQALESTEIATQVLDALEPIAAQRNITLVKELNAERSIVGDPDRIVQILNNLVGNAIKFSPANSIVVLKVTQNTEATKFQVIDQGSQLSPDDIDKLFVRFQQLDSSDGRRKGGTGLGLSICKSLVELHGGHIGVDNSGPTGNTFWFEIF